MDSIRNFNHFLPQCGHVVFGYCSTKVIGLAIIPAVGSYLILSVPMIQISVPMIQISLPPIMAQIMLMMNPEMTTQMVEAQVQSM